MCYHVYVIICVKIPKQSTINVGHYVPLAGFCLSCYGLHVLNRGINMIQTKKTIYKDKICLKFRCLDAYHYQIDKSQSLVIHKGTCMSNLLNQGCFRNVFQDSYASAKIMFQNMAKSTNNIHMTKSTFAYNCSDVVGMI